MTIFMRVDSSEKIGFGHLARCMTLADAFRSHNKTISFISRDLPGNAIQLVINKGYNVHLLKHDQDEINQVRRILSSAPPVTCLVIDHYQIEKNWESAIKSSVRNLMVIDDLANRKHDCDILLDQNYSPKSNARYNGLIPKTALCLLGPHYAILNGEFRQMRSGLADKTGQIKNILISFGGSDPSNETEKAIMACSRVDYNNLKLDVVVGAANQNKIALASLCKSMPNVNYHFQTNDMARLMAQADLAIGAGGITMWERCCLGLPAIVISIANNQEEGAQHLSAYGAITYLGKSEEVSVEQLFLTINKMIKSPNCLQAMCAAGKELVDGNGCLRIIEKLASLGI